MGKLNASLLRYLSYEDIAALSGVEAGMKNHELVAAPLVASLANLQSGGIHHILKQLCKNRLLSYERGKKYDGYRLTNLGYDYLALHELTERKVISYFGNQIGVGKESNIYTVANEEGEEVCLKLHRLGRVCFRKVTEKRDYHKHAKALSWLYLSRISATKEFSYMTALFEEGFPVPKPISCNRHCVVMDLVKGTLLNHIIELKDPENLYEQLMDIIVRFASAGLIHGDFNEFNIMITEEENPIIIDFPQMMSTRHIDAEMYFNRDVECIRTFFKKRFGYDGELYPKLSEIERTCCLDAQVRCTGFTGQMAKSLNEEMGLESKNSSDDESDHTEVDENDHQEINENKGKGKNDYPKLSDIEKSCCLDTKENDESSDVEENCENKTLKFENKVKGHDYANIEKWLSTINLKDSNEETEHTIESEDDSDDCPINEYLSKAVSAVKDVEKDYSDYDEIHSVTSTVTISEEERRKRCRKQLKREKMKQVRKNCLVKGQASAVRRSRKANVDHIKDTKFLFDL